jgi:hypothetical protein
MIFEERRGVWIPGFLAAPRSVAYPPLTEQIRGLLPAFVMRGAGAAAWHAVAEAVASNRDEFTLVMEAIGEVQAGADLVAAAQKVRVIPEGDPGEGFARRIVEHFVEAAGNAIAAQPAACAWV